ncbi:MAG: DNA-3-methyladenine glycosylase family protein [Candidatus Dormibacteria bacterium]
MDRWDGERLRRPLRLGDRLLAVAVRAAGPGLVEVDFSDPEPPPAALAAVSRMFIDQTEALTRLAGSDPAVRRLWALFPGLLAVRYLDPLGALVASVTAQQVNLQFAVKVRRDLLQRLGRRIAIGSDFVLAPDPAALAGAGPDDFRALRLTAAKGRCLKALGEAVSDRVLDFDELARLPDAEVVSQLVRVPGIGRWTALQYLGRVLGRPVLVAEDLGVRKAVQRAYELVERPSPELVRELTSGYGEAALAAQQLLLHGLASAAAAAGPPRGGSGCAVSPGRDPLPVPPAAAGRRHRAARSAPPD